MHLDQNPFFRKTITPWYDANPACWLVIGVMIPVFILALAGIAVAWSDPDLAEHAWFPATLAGLSFFLVVKTALRLWQRYQND
jgi:hypothetical protein